MQQHAFVLYAFALLAESVDQSWSNNTPNEMTASQMGSGECTYLCAPGA